MIIAKLVHGIETPKPIVNIPHDALKSRLRMRQADIARVYIRFSDRIERWIIAEDGDHWRLEFKTGENRNL